MAEPQISTDLLLVTAWFCPFAQRTFIAIKEKRCPHSVYELCYADLYGKPEWFTRLNPKGQIPVLAYKEGEGVKTVYESLICNEYLEERFNVPALLPPDPFHRAQCRLIIDRFSSTVQPAFYKILLKEDPAVRSKCREILDKELTWLDTLLATGPYFLGAQFSLVDCAIVPFLLRLPVLEVYRQYQEPECCLLLRAYIKTVQQRASVQASMYHPENKNYMQELIKSYSRYADGTAPSIIAREIRET